MPIKITLNDPDIEPLTDEEITKLNEEFPDLPEIAGDYRWSDSNFWLEKAFARITQDSKIIEDLKKKLENRD